MKTKAKQERGVPCGIAVDFVSYRGYSGRVNKEECEKMFKEKGYDEFLAEKIRRAQEDIKAGRVLTLKESRKRTLAMLERKAREFEERDNHVYA